MIVKGTKQLGSFKRGINIYVPKKKIVVPPAPSGIPVASTNSINLNNALAYYQSYFGSGYFIGNPQSFSKIDSNFYFDGSVNYIRYIGYWQWYWDNNDNSYNLIDLTSATDPNFIPNDWGNGVTITAADSSSSSSSSSSSPSGIPVATAIQNGINVSTSLFGVIFCERLNESFSGYNQIVFPSNDSAFDDIILSYNSSTGLWTLIENRSSEDTDYLPNFSRTSTVAGTADYIPTTGWPEGVTITAV